MNEIIPTITVRELISRGEADIQTGPFGTQLKASEYVDFGIPVINVRNVGFGNIRDAELEFITDAKAEKLKAHQLRKGDIVFGRKGAVERHALIDEEQSGWIQGSDCLRLRLKSSGVCERYASYYLRTRAHQDWMQALCSFGATMASLNQDIVKRITIPLPVLTTQRKIAAILTAYDDLIEVNKRRISLLEKMAEEIYGEWFVRMRFPGYKDTRFVKGVPEGWETLRFADICHFIKGKTPSDLSGQPLDDYSPYVNAAFLKGEEPEYAKHEKSSVLCDNGDVLMLMDGSNSGHVFRAKQGIVASTFSRVASDRKHQHFVFEFLRASRDSIISNNTGSAVPHANKEFINRLVIFAPADDEVLISFNKMYQGFLDQRTNLETQNENLTKTRDLLLPRLISGKLSVEDLDIQFPPSMREEAA